jgi:predicted amidohydrolase YtcJ
VAGFKGFLDGSLGARTAAISGSYDGGQEDGMLLGEEEALLGAIQRGRGAGFAIALHAIGLRAIRQALSTYASPRPIAEDLLRIEHGEQCDDAAMERAAELGVVWSMQPNFTARWQGTGGMYEAMLGPARARSLNRFRSVWRSGRLLFGSDMMPAGPLEGLIGALEHPDPAERLPLAAALQAYMLDGPVDGGFLDAGQPAELVVLEAPRGNLSEAILNRSARVVWTYAAGRTLWCDPEAGAPKAFQEPDS